MYCAILILGRASARDNPIVNYFLEGILRGKGINRLADGSIADKNTDKVSKFLPP